MLMIDDIVRKELYYGKVIKDHKLDLKPPPAPPPAPPIAPSATPMGAPPAIIPFGIVIVVCFVSSVFYTTLFKRNATNTIVCVYGGNLKRNAANTIVCVYGSNLKFVFKR